MLRTALILLSIASQAHAQAPAGFDDSSGRLRLFTASYELTLSKENGAILGITDRAAHASLTLGSRNGCLWGATFLGTPPVIRGGCDFKAGGANVFRYGWDAARSTLTLHYTPDPKSARRVEATVTIAIRPEWFDLKLAVANHMGAVMDTAPFPSDLLFSDTSVEAGYLPYYLPGARLKPGFFTANRSVPVTYPGCSAFADYIALEIHGGRIARYAVNPGARIMPAAIGFVDNDKGQRGTFSAPHTFQTWTPDGGTFESPVVRFRVGQGIEQTIMAYRVENGIANYPTIAKKLGSLFPTIARAPLVKIPMTIPHAAFRELEKRLDQIRAPAILHPVSYWVRNFDQNYPDFLPPNPNLGTSTDFEAFIEAAHRRGLFVMPYTNPTWWDEKSPTLLNAPDLAAFAMIGKDGKPVHQSYAVNTGIVVSPYSPAVRERLAKLMAQWRGEVKVDFVFQDQIGSRPWMRDLNPAAPDPQSFSDGWLEHTRTYASQRLMTEDGWDRLAATETGFDGSLLNRATGWDPKTIRWGKDSRANHVFGAGLWEPYPLGVWLFHDKVLFYHHDLSHPVMNAGVEVLTWNCAFGVMAGYLWPELHGMNPEWVAIVSAFQPAVLSRMAGRTLSSYRTLADDVTESRFGDLSTVANWNPNATYATDGYTIAPSGCFTRGGDGSLVAGVFTEQFNGGKLSEGPHYLIVERGGSVITVRQPSGAATSLTIPLPADWNAGGGIRMQALSRDNRVIAAAPAQINGNALTFAYEKAIAGTPVDRYEISRAPRWMISTSALRHLDKVDPSGALSRRFFESPGNFVMNGLKGAEGFPQGSRCAPTATFPSYQALKEAFENGRVPASVKAIIYDNESWKFTPPEEQHDIERFEKLAAEMVHRHGRIFIATPATDLVQVLSPHYGKGTRYDEFLRLGIARHAARYADVYEVQAQGSVDNLALYTRHVRGAAEQARSVNPKVLVFAGLSTNPSGKKVTAKQLYDAIEATRDVVDGYWLNIPGGGAYCPKCGEPQPGVAAELLKMLDR